MTCHWTHVPAKVMGLDGGSEPSCLKTLTQRVTWDGQAPTLARGIPAAFLPWIQALLRAKGKPMCHFFPPEQTHASLCSRDHFLRSDTWHLPGPRDAKPCFHTYSFLTCSNLFPRSQDLPFPLGTLPLLTPLGDSSSSLRLEGTTGWVHDAQALLWAHSVIKEEKESPTHTFLSLFTGTCSDWLWSY